MGLINSLIIGIIALAFIGGGLSILDLTSPQFHGFLSNPLAVFGSPPVDLNGLINFLIYFAIAMALIFLGFTAHLIRR